jgi:predicted transcriptional regulator
MKVSDLIGSRREIFAVLEDASVLEAAQYLYEKQIRAAGVVNRLGQLAGVIAQSDISDKVAAKNLCPAWVKVSDIMSTRLFRVTPHMHFEEGMKLMEQEGVHHLVIVEENGEFHGMLSINDLLKAMVWDEKERADVLESYVYAVR